ncbi:MAG: PHP domain-containing protein [Candidatus Ratteibacteria bacterium]
MDGKIKKRKIKKYFIFILLTLFFNGCLIKYYGKKEIIIINPYENINWNTIKKYKANFHTHTKESDGKETPEKVISLYKMKNYSILSITDHNKLTFIKTEELFLIPGIEFGKNQQHHIISLFSFKTPEKIETINEEEILKYVDEKKGISFFSHPGRYTKSVDWYLNLFEKYQNLVGIEVLNPSVQTKGKVYGDTDIWDEILKNTMPDRPVWGFGNDDFHNLSQLGINWNILLLEKLDEKEIREAIKMGKFYICSSFLGTDLPYLKKVIVNKKTGKIKIDCENFEKIKWISDGKIISHGSEINYKNNHEIKKYLRVEIFSKNGYIYLNPFGIREVKK